MTRLISETYSNVLTNRLPIRSIGRLLPDCLPKTCSRASNVTPLSFWLIMVLWGSQWSSLLRLTLSHNFMDKSSQIWKQTNSLLFKLTLSYSIKWLIWLRLIRLQSSKSKIRDKKDKRLSCNKSWRRKTKEESEKRRELHSERKLSLTTSKNRSLTRLSWMLSMLNTSQSGMFMTLETQTLLTMDLSWLEDLWENS